MGGKKKSLANRLAKMSDEERARYMQMKADQEEEARRRKEQLVTAFMKNKIRREDVFSRLNNAKINQQWHQFMRVRKCREMKENCEHSRKWIERTITLKNRTIDNLMKELDEAEFQYSINLQAHLQHVDHFLEFHRKYLEQVQSDCENDLDLILKQAADERMIYRNKADADIEHLKALVYGQETVGWASVKDDHDYYLKSTDKCAKEFQAEFKILRTKNYETCGAIWRDISTVIGDYIELTDKRRAQLADMRRLDAESAAEINQNQERIDTQEIQIEKLNEEYLTLRAIRRNTILSLQATSKVINLQFLDAKKNLQSELTLDEKKLRILIHISRKCIDQLEGVVGKGEHVLQMIQSCRRHETQKEKILRFSALPIEHASTSSSSSESSDINKHEIEKEEILEEVFMKVKMDSIDGNLDQDMGSDEKEHTSSAGVSSIGKETPKIEETQKYKILIRHKYPSSIKKPKKLEIGAKLKKELDMIASTSSVCPKRKSEGLKYSTSTEDSSPSLQSKTGIIEENIESLMKLDAIWFLFNKVKLDYNEMKEEKTQLIQENQLLKNTIKRVLEEEILKKDSMIDTIRKNRYASAPARYYM